MTVVVDVDADIATAVWRDGDAWGVRCLHLGMGFITDVTWPGNAPIWVAAVGSGAVAVLEGCSAAADHDLALRAPVRSVSFVDVVAGTVRWAEPLDVEPLVDIVPGLVRTSWTGSWFSPAVPGRHASIRRLPDGELSLSSTTADAFEGLLAARRATRAAMPGRIVAVEGSAEFTFWATVVRSATGRTPIMKLIALRHAGHDVVGYFDHPDQRGREHLLIARGGSVLWERRPTAGDGATVELVGGAWDPVGFHVEGGWLVAVTDPGVAELFPIG